MRSQIPAYGSDRDQGHEHPGRRRRGAHRPGERGDDAEGEEQREQPEGRHERRPRRRGAGVAPEQAMRADQRAEKAPRRVDEKRNAHEKRVPAPRAAGRTRDRARHETGQPHRSRRLLGALGPRVGRETEPGDGDEHAGRSQMKSRYASAPAMIPPPVSTSRSTTSNTTSTDSWRSRSACARSAISLVRAWSALAWTAQPARGRPSSSSCRCVSSAGSTMPRPPCVIVVRPVRELRRRGTDRLCVGDRERCVPRIVA